MGYAPPWPILANVWCLPHPLPRDWYYYHQDRSLFVSMMLILVLCQLVMGWDKTGLWAEPVYIPGKRGVWCSNWEVGMGLCKAPLVDEGCTDFPPLNHQVSHYLVCGLPMSWLISRIKSTFPLTSSITLPCDIHQ